MKMLFNGKNFFVVKISPQKQPFSTFIFGKNKTIFEIFVAMWNVCNSGGDFLAN
jgi:hypothetical protein